ncbi:MAG: DUF502 domain-containing protein [Deltaproteobacteria bacterium]|nr:DUF502 domain-containing protein [Deltaproteobacteria bacterium]
MKQAKSFIRTTLLGGLVVILPATIILTVFGWIYVKVTDWIQPLTDIVVRAVGLGEFVADIVVFATIAGVCFLIGLTVRTGVGKFIHNKLESRVLKVAPGYTMVKETVLQFLGRKKAPFSKVALVQVFENSTMATAFITDEHRNGSYTVFVPTGPNPTSGQIFHMEGKFVHPVDVGVDEAMRTIISCGAGSDKLITTLLDADRID